MAAVVNVENLSKKYLIARRQRESYVALRDVLAAWARSFVGRGNGGGSHAADVQEDFWALRDVNLEIREGDRLGIIGRNGAGKSTLLKVLSRITEPTSGRIRIRGRVASLLEVGTGFHPELTGRENIYLNGAILGMSRADIRKRFDDIVEFAEVSRFLDTPVKRYSSGMYVRLAFAVAAHLEPDILIVDEVLAVGDAMFQKKCIGKMDDVARAGRTVIFVSHTMETVLRLCTRAILLNEGRVQREGDVESVVNEYLHTAQSAGGEHSWSGSQCPGNTTVRLLALRTRAAEGGVSSRFSVEESIDVEVDYEVLEDGKQLCAVLEFVSMWDQPVIVGFDQYVRGPWGSQPAHPRGLFRAAFRVPGNLLTEGEFSVNLRIFSPPLPPNETPHVRVMRGLQFVVFDAMDGGGARGSFPHSWGTPPLRPLIASHTTRI